ncbi:prohibitin family protein [Deltaproteobacteria bacterium TL4]
MMENQTNVPQSNDRFHIILFVVLSITFFLLVFFIDNIIISVKAGEAAVLFRRFQGGTVMDKVYGEGIHFILPINYMVIYDVKIQEVTQQVDVISQNGLVVEVSVSVRYRPIVEDLPRLHQLIGTDYLNKIILPITISAVRKTIGRYRQEELYTTVRDQYQREVLIHAIEEAGRLPVQFNDIVVRNIKLPTVINAAIEQKLRHEQAFLEYEFRIKSEQKEAERKKIEAGGYAAYNRIISQSLTDRILMLKGIEVTEQLAKSNNSKVVIMGNSSKNLPVILSAESWNKGPNRGAETQATQEETDSNPSTQEETDSNPSTLETSPSVPETNEEVK